MILGASRGENREFTNTPNETHLHISRGTPTAQYASNLAVRLFHSGF